MSQNGVLYVKGMDDSESEVEAEQDIWDDKKLNDAYDKALRIANAEVAKRIAMSTNSKHEKQDKKAKNSKHAKSKQPQTIDTQSTAPKNKTTEWMAGMPCRAIYEDDGLEYEAFVLRILNDKECVVRFLGYDNCEVVLIKTLKPTKGNDERTRQIEQALCEKTDDGFGSQSPDYDRVEYASDRIPSPGSTEKSFQKKSSKKKKKNSQNVFGCNLPEMPMPNISMLRNLGSMEMPMPPPPMMFPPLGGADSEDQAVSSMLISWYMSGYYTGLYQGMKRAKKTRNYI